MLIATDSRQPKPVAMCGGPTILIEEGNMTGKELITMMRRHKVTIRELARRIQIPQKRVRIRRDIGLDAETARDWIQSITGVDPGPQITKATR